MRLLLVELLQGSLRRRFLQHDLLFGLVLQG
jgi:hypothetical protein